MVAPGKLIEKAKGGCQFHMDEGAIIIQLNIKRFEERNSP
jgi:hypothetical protein